MTVKIDKYIRDEAGVIVGYVISIIETVEEVEVAKDAFDLCVEFGVFEMNTGVNIEQRTPGSLVGKPTTLAHMQGAKPSPKQRRLLELLDGVTYIELSKSKNCIKVLMSDLCVLTLLTELEYALFERNDSYIIFKGTKHHIPLSSKWVTRLRAGRYKWVGHTHVGMDVFCLAPSAGDYETLRALGQEQSFVYNSVGASKNFYV